MARIEDEIKEIIKMEIAQEQDLTNWHNTDLQKCLVEPYREICEIAFDSKQTVEVYVVLKEFPDHDEGYQIVFDPKYGKFGLTIEGAGSKRVLLGYDGTFLDSFRGM
ncbi:MAG: hypothetical protein K0S74_1851 [Chlamydiales bacterium]|jgi:hypothetical protein|nr:hypothetical protein [Chlamydiales bacterium]